MKTLKTFSIKTKTYEQINELKKHGYSKSEAIDKAVEFFFNYRLDEETIAKINKLSQVTKLTKPQVIAFAVKIFEDIIENFGRKKNE